MLYFDKILGRVVMTMGRRILCFGDSNTYGYDPRSYLGGRYPASVRWTALLKTLHFCRKYLHYVKLC